MAARQQRRTRFCGWVDVGLSGEGEREAFTARDTLQADQLDIDVAFTSLLKRANRTLEIILETFQNIQVVKDWRLNERHYGGLTGLDKAQCVKQYGKDQVSVWRRSWDVRPPAMETEHPFYSSIVSNPSFKGVLEEEEIPRTESLQDLVERTLPLWRDVIVPEIMAGKTVLIVAHGTSLRGLVKHIENLSEEEIRKTDLPNGIPFLYEFDEQMELVQKRRYLADPAIVETAIAKVNNILR